MYKFWVCTCNSNDKIVTSENIFLLNLILSLSGATPLSNAEKQRRYRERLNKDPDRKREYLEKKKQKYQDDIKVGKRKRVSDFTDREKRTKRKEWRKEKQELRKKQKSSLALQALTPPVSPDNLNNSANSQHNISTRIRRRKLAKCYRENEKLRKALSTQTKLSQKYLMRLRREKARKQQANDSPRRKVNNLLRHWTTSNQKNPRKQVEGKKTVRRSLLYHFSLKKELRLRYSQANKKEKKSLAEMLKGKVMKKYQLIKQAYKEIGICIGRYSVKTKGSLRKRLGPSVRAFYQRDDNSRITPGMKQTVTKNKLKMQKRILMSSLKDLHDKFLSENPDLKMSNATFCRLRPFWVVQPSESDRDTCACKQHENTQNSLWCYRFNSSSYICLKSSNVNSLFLRSFLLLSGDTLIFCLFLLFYV